MKSIIFSFLFVFLVSSQGNAQSLIKQAYEKVTGFFSSETPVESAPGNCVRNPLLPGCPSNAPVNTLSKIFENNFPEVSYSRTQANQDEAVTSVFGTSDHAIYVVTSKNNDFIEMYQGAKDSNCHYKYKIGTNSTKSRRTCTADAPKDKGINCVSKWAKDPLLQKEAVCEEFIQAMTACSRNSQSTQRCINTIYAINGNLDKSRENPIPNPNNKPLPGSSPGIAEDEFSGEPDTSGGSR